MFNLNLNKFDTHHLIYQCGWLCHIGTSWDQTHFTTVSFVGIWVGHENKVSVKCLSSKGVYMYSKRKRLVSKQMSVSKEGILVSIFTLLPLQVYLFPLTQITGGVIQILALTAAHISVTYILLSKSAFEWHQK